MIIKVQRHQHKDKAGANIVVNCVGNVATYVPGSVPSTIHDISHDVKGLESMELYMEEGANGKLKEKTGTNNIIIIGESAQMIKDWIFGTPCSILNYWTATIEDDTCNPPYLYKPFEIKPENIESCDPDLCIIEVPLREIDDKKRMLEAIPVTDDWQGWFNGHNGQPKKDFPTHEFVVHNSPMQHGMNVGWWLFVKTFATVPGTPIGIGGIVSMIIDIDEAVNKGLGFGYFHPLVSIRDILTNAMAKIGKTIDTPFNVGRTLQDDHYCFVRGGEYYRRGDASCLAPDTKFIWNNRNLQNIKDFLDNICQLYSARWAIVDNVLKIDFLKDVISQAPVATIPDEDISKHCKTLSAKKRPGMGDYSYSLDGGDQKSNTIGVMYDDVVDYDGVADNALYEGSVDKKVKFAPTSFWGDGFGEDMLTETTYYGKMVAIILNAMMWVGLLIAVVPMIIGANTPVVIAGFAGGLGGGMVSGTTVPAGVPGVAIAVAVAAITALFGTNVAGIFVEISNIRDRFAYDSCHEGAIHLFGTGQMNMPRIIRLQNGRPMNDPRPVKTPSSSIVIAPRYDIPIGSTPPWNLQFNGGYGAKLFAFNYPLVFDAKYLGNLYDIFHEMVDSALFVAQTNEDAKIEIPLCCEYLTMTGINSDLNNLIGKVITFKGKKLLVKKVLIKKKDSLIEISGKIIL